MGYSVFIQRFRHGEPSPAPFIDVVPILQKYGSAGESGARLEFRPTGSDLCEVGFIGGERTAGIESIGFSRPAAGGRMNTLIFELLAVPGMCYVEQDCTCVMARTDITSELPEALLRSCDSGPVTVISSIPDLPL